MARSSDSRAPDAHHGYRRSAARGSEIAGLALVFLLISLAAAAADCTCRARGHDYQHGERVCLSGPDGPRLATCGMSQNVASWLLSDQSCSVSTLEFRAVLASHEAPPGDPALR